MGFPVQAKGTVPTSDLPSSTGKATKTTAQTAAGAATPTVAPTKAKSALTATSTLTKDKATPQVSSTSSPITDKAKATLAKTSDKPTTATVAHSTPSSRLGSATTIRNHSATVAHKDEGERLARVTAYWAGEGDYYTGRCLSSTGIHLHNGHCAVDPRIIPYGSVVNISGVGSYVAVDTGSAVISREAAREAAHTPEQRNALVIDLFFESRRDGERFANSGPKYAAISWTTPMAAGNTTPVPESHTLIADGALSPDGNKL